MTNDLHDRDTVRMLNEVHAWFVRECREPNPMAGEIVEGTARRPFAMLAILSKAIASIMCRRGALISEFVEVILHGDDEHKAWLREAADAWITGNPIPPARSLADRADEQQRLFHTPCCGAETKKGDRVRFLNENGYDSERKEAAVILDEAKTYVVEFVNVGSWRTALKLEGVPGFFNSVMFASVAGEEPIQ